MTNFDFLKRVNENLFIIAMEAEKLFRDEYFEQCITQTRRLAENICRDVMGENAASTDTFDDMLATLKDTPAQNDFEKEFLDDLYFLKKAGNDSVHSLTVKQDGHAALDCLQRAFEAALNYAVFKKGLDSKYLKQQFDEELLATGKKAKKTRQQVDSDSSSVKEKYTREKEKLKNNSKRKKSKKSDFEDNLDITDNYDKKPLWKEILETIGAGLIITAVYFLIFNK